MTRQRVNSDLYRLQNRRNDEHAYLDDDAQPVCRRMIYDEVPLTAAQIREALAERRCAFCRWALREFLSPPQLGDLF